jgi:hypothetical protein
MQVDASETFVARLEEKLCERREPRAVRCENFGISATGPLEYYHRILHDVLKKPAPDAVVLCLYPGNDFQADLPDNAFEKQGTPRTDYFENPSWGQHVLTWINLHSKLGHFVIRSVRVRMRASGEHRAPRPKWWKNPAIARRDAQTLPVARMRSLLHAIEAACHSRGSRLVVLVVGPVATYGYHEGRSPLATIFSDWGMQAPVIDLSSQARMRADWQTWLFPRDGHLTASGHEQTALLAVEPLSAALKLPR